ncbi:hypothetical protein C1645_814208 [Glomus cerebriforme]|uniref:WSC domain-containing protein n=1 Tax=Glomus cerebriforme TaxID=658196 RepID=A0A397TGU5_9GLOM|nr:hypothetical protein C1645_814208 [Glomus cerebriforme]
MANENSEKCVEPCANGSIPRDDPQVFPIGCFVFDGSYINDSFNGLTTLKNPNNPSLTFPDPYKDQDVGYCSKLCIDFMFSYFGMGNGSDCRCGDQNALQSYIKVDDKKCNIPCNFLTDKGNVTYPCGGKGAYTIYKAERSDYVPPTNITLEEKLNIIYNIDNEPHYEGCFEDNKNCGQRILGNKCESLETMTVNGCIDYCRRLKSSVDCSASCLGNSSQICGGEWTLSIYEISTPTNTPLPLTPPSNKDIIRVGLAITY